MSGPSLEYKANGAAVLRRPDLGSLEPGKAADFIAKPWQNEKLLATLSGRTVYAMQDKDGKADKSGLSGFFRFADDLEEGRKIAQDLI